MFGSRIRTSQSDHVGPCSLHGVHREGMHVKRATGSWLIVVPAKDGTGFYFEAKWSHPRDGSQVKRRVGRAWVEPRATPMTDAYGWQKNFKPLLGPAPGGLSNG